MAQRSLVVGLVVVASLAFAASPSEVHLEQPSLKLRFPGEVTHSAREVETVNGLRHLEQWRHIAADGSVYMLSAASLDDEPMDQRDVDFVLFRAEDAIVGQLNLEPKTDGRATLQDGTWTHQGLSLTATFQDGMGFYSRFFVVDAVLIQVTLISRTESSRAQAAFEAFADTLATTSAPAQEPRVSRP